MDSKEELPVPENQRHRFRDILDNGNSSPPLSINMPSGVEGAIQSVDMQSFERPLDTLPQNEPERPGFFSTAFHTVKELEMGAHAIDYAYHESKRHEAEQGLENQNPLADVTPPNWTPFEVKNFEGFDRNYFSYLADSHSPAQLQAKQQEVTRLMQENEEYKDGSVWGKIFGFTASAAMDYAVLRAIPIATSAKYAKYSESILQSLKASAPGTLIQTGAYTAAIDATTTGKTMADFGEDFLINSVAGLALTGAAAGLGRGMTGGQMFAARHALKMNFQGIKAIQVFGKDGELLGLKAEQMYIEGVNENFSQAQNAMHIAEAQKFLDSQMTQSGFFAIPYVGGALKKGISAVSPVFRFLNSEWRTLRGYMNHMADHSIEVQGVTTGSAQPDNYEYMVGEYRSQSIQMKDVITGYMAEANGFGGGVTGAIKNLNQKITKDPEFFTTPTWGYKVMSSRFTGIKSEVNAVNSLNGDLDVHFSEMLGEYQRAKGLEEIDFPVRTAEAYLNRQYATGYMATAEGEDRFINSGLAFLTRGDAAIAKAIRPLESIEASIKQTRSNIHEGIDAEANRVELRRLNRSFRQANDELKENIRNDIEANNKEGLHNLLDENILPTKADEKFLIKTLKPHKESLAKLKSAERQSASINSELSSQRKKFESGTKKGSKPKDYAEIKNSIQELEAKSKLLEDEEYKAYKDSRDEWNELMAKVRSGEIRRSMYYQDLETGKVTFKKPNQKPKFRPMYSRHPVDGGAQMLLDMNATYTKIMGNDPDKLAHSMLETLESRVTGNPLKERSYLIPDQILLEEGLLSTDLAKNVASYTMTLGKRIAHAKALKTFGQEYGQGEGGFKGVMDELAKDFENKKGGLRAAGLTQEKLDKAFKKLNNSYKKAQADLQNAESVAAGTYATFGYNNTLRHVFNTLRSGAAATKLGNLPIAQIPDLAVATFKNSIWRWLRDGIGPLLGSMNGIIKTEAGIRYRKTASSVGLALERSMHSKADELWNMQTALGQTTASRVSDSMAWQAQKANTLSLSASIENMNQNIIANISSSSLIEHMYSYRDGTISPRDLRMLLQFGIDPAKESSLIINAFEHSPTSIKKKTGGYASDFWNWEDKEARVVMAKHIRKSVAATLVRKGMFDSPLVSNDPVIGMAFTFTGWAFAGLNRFAVPALQRPFDAYMLQGTVMTSALGALVDPLRVWSRGEEFDMSDEAWFGSAISSSPPLALAYTALMRAASFVDNDTLNKMKGDRYRNLSRRGGYGGAPAGIIEDMGNFAQMFGTGHWNRHDIKGFAHSIPLINQWYTHKMLNDFIDDQTSDLPKNYGRASR